MIHFFQVHNRKRIIACVAQRHLFCPVRQIALVYRQGNGNREQHTIR